VGQLEPDDETTTPKSSLKRPRDDDENDDAMATSVIVDGNLDSEDLPEIQVRRKRIRH